ncbi:hypothetical protein RE438_31405 (plasmid) [Bacillus wiedmannii]|uniref:hypothetical protein n=1 Tax=Bacillus cereus group TaxID=86661 RepID=UPI00065BF1FE|nr:hypothetical protein [Bacillus wiedmannii]KMP77362.1 hypothetical protein TU62_04640 [Bacillus cereus]WMS85374.1 hypothetical protein RE438_31405 [Bacillus wiedmannii]
MFKNKIVTTLSISTLLFSGGLFFGGGQASAAQVTTETDIHKYITVNSKAFSDQKNNLKIELGYTVERLYGMYPYKYTGNYDLIKIYEHDYNFDVKAIKKGNNPEFNKVTVRAKHPQGGYIYYHITVI